MNRDVSRRERVIALVQERIAVAPNPFIATEPRIDIMAWMRPALVAAGIVIVSSVSLLSRQRTDAEPNTVIEALGVPKPLSGFVATGRVNSLDFLFPPEGER